MRAYKRAAQKAAKRWLRVGLLVALTMPLAGPAEQVEDRVGEHIVAPGENLWSITRKYLGDDFLWKENWKLNPQIDDPNKLRIGQKLNVIKERKITADQALVSEVSNQVDKNLKRSAWLPATPGDQLGEQDGVRTLRNSSAELEFNDFSRLRLSEYSQVFFESKTTTLRGVDRGRIKIDSGSAELLLDPAGRQRTEIELLAGSAVSRPRPGADGWAQVAAGADAESGASRVMVYSGASTVEASGTQVSLKKGTGTAVPKDGPPSPPEALLPGPQDLNPGGGSRWEIANHPLRWTPLAAAGHYRVEICRDADCARLAQRSPPLNDAFWEPRLEQIGDYYWRVRAISHSGLEGYPSEALRFHLASLRYDEAGPVVAVLPTGPLRFHRGRVIAGPSAQLRLLAFDEGIGVDWLEYRWRAGDWQRHSGEAVSLTVPIGAEWLEVRAADRLGQVGATQTVPIDTSAKP